MYFENSLTNAEFHVDQNSISKGLNNNVCSMGQNPVLIFNWVFEYKPITSKIC